MITSEEEYATTLEWVAKFVASLDRLDVSPDTEPHRAQRIAAAAQLGSLRRELAMREAGIREPVPPSPDAPELSEGSHDRAGASVRLQAGRDRQHRPAGGDRAGPHRLLAAATGLAGAGDRRAGGVPAEAASSESAPDEVTPAAAMPAARAG